MKSALTFEAKVNYTGVCYFLDMASFLPKSIRDLIDEFARLPGVGPKSAQRLAMYLLHSPDSRVKELAGAVSGLKEGLQFCSKCWNISESELCRLCSDPGRDDRQICVVEEILDVVAIEKTMEYRGLYHVLHGALSPVDGVGPEQLKISELEARVKLICEDARSEADEVPLGDVLRDAGHGHELKSVEVILATNPGLEGETTALYLMKLLKPLGARVTRIARGLPVGGDLDYADEMTLSKAITGRGDYF